MSTLTGTKRLVWFILRRDRLRLSLWLLGLAGLAVVSAGSLPAVYKTEAAIRSYATTAGDNPAAIAFAGPGYGFDDPTIGDILVNEVQLFTMIGVALMAVFLVNRHTRAEEDSEQAELVRSCVVGRHAPMAAVLAVVTAQSAIIGLACYVGFIGFGYESTGSAALAASIAIPGVIFAGVALVFAQVMSSGRGVLSSCNLLLGASFVVRAVGDVAGNGVSWLSPIGWAQAVRAFAGEQWWVMALCLAVSGALVAAAFRLSDIRDLGSGLIAPKGGPPAASDWMIGRRRGDEALTGRAVSARTMRALVGLAARLQVPSLIAWTAGLFVLGVVYGAFGNDVEQMIEDNPAMADFIAMIGEANPVDAYFAAAASMLAITAIGYSISAVMRIRSEETSGHVEVLLSTPASRSQLAVAHMVFAVTGSVLVIAAAGAGMGVAFAVVEGDPSEFVRLLIAALVTVPAVLVLVGATLLLVGLSPARTNLAWALLVAVFVLSYLGELLRIPYSLRQLSPLEHVPAMPVEDFALLPLVVLLLVSGAMAAAGITGLRRRDLHT